MLNWITTNLGTIVVGAAVLAIAIGISGYLIRQKKRGKTSCGCGCANCPSQGHCHS